VSATPVRTILGTRARKSARPGKPGRASAFVLPLAVLIVLFAVWQFATTQGYIDDLFLPAPTDIAIALADQPMLYVDNALITLSEIGIGASIGIVLGVLLGTAVALIPAVRLALYPLLVASQSLPILALAPILMLWLGFGILPKIVIVVQLIFFPVTVATVQGLSSVKEEVLVFGKSLGASGWSMFWKVRFPAMLPHLFAGLKIASSYAAVAAVVAEWTGSEGGLGAIMTRANSDYNTVVVFGCVAVITAIGLGLFGLCTLLERLVTPWAKAGASR
jgi:ABC-type nitrate/sulfonate/bicarbonate transport system permease component